MSRNQKWPVKSEFVSAILTSFVIQGIGSFAPFLTVVLLARIAGPETQGIFSIFKTWLDLVLSVIVFGFPQAFIYLLNKRMVSKCHLLNGSLIYAAAATVCVMPLAAYSVSSGYNSLPHDHGILFYSLFLSLGVGGLLFHRLIRGIYLTIDDGFLFALITSAPGTFLLTAMVFAAQFVPFDYDVAFFVASALTCFAVAVWVRRIVAATPDYKLTLPRLPVFALLKQSGYVFLQSVSFTLQPVITIYLIKASGGETIEVAFFTAATIIIAAVNVFFGLVAPILFNRWSANLNVALLARILRASDAIALAFFAIGLASIPLYESIVPIVFGGEYAVAVFAFQIVACAMAPVAFTRTIASAIHAAGRPDINTVSCAARLSVSVLVQVALLLTSSMSPVADAVTAWVIAEWLAAVYSRQAGRRLLTWFE